MDKSKTLLLDTGNLLFQRYNAEEAGVYRERHNLIIEAMNMMSYDIANLGINDISPDIRMLEDRCQKAAFTTLSANATIKGDCKQHPIQKYIIKEVNGIRIGITGVMPNAIPAIEGNLTEGKFNIDDPKTALDKIIPNLAAKTDYIILLSSFNYKDTLNLLTQIPAIDLGLCIETERLPLPFSDDNSQKPTPPLIMNITTRGMELGMLNIEKDKNRVSITHAEIISLGQKVPSDEKILELSWKLKEWEKKKKIDDELLKKQGHEALLKNLELSPEEFFKQQSKKE